MSKNLLDVKNLKTHFLTKDEKVTAVDNLSFRVKEGEIVAVVGESGCGKSVMSQSILRLLDQDDSAKVEGKLIYKGEDLLKYSEKEMEKIRGKEIAMIFQDPSSSLSPVFTIGHQISEAILLHQNISKKEAYKKAEEMLELTGIPSPENRINEYPHQLSGGMQQRALIAMALSCRPDLLIADEPTTSLDVTIQAQILDLILNLNKKFNMGLIFITHDLGVVAEISHKVIVMYLGQIVEEGPVKDLFKAPLHPYTQGLMNSVPKLSTKQNEQLYAIEGTVPSLSKIPQGCRFATRCPYATNLCREKEPKLEKKHHNQKVKCWHVEKIQKGDMLNANS